MWCRASSGGQSRRTHTSVGPVTGVRISPASPRGLTANVLESFLPVVRASGCGRSPPTVRSLPCRSGQLPSDRFRALEPRERRAAPDLRGDPVQVAQPRRHISTTWRLSSVLGQYITTVPAQQRLGRRWYTGSADAFFQSLNLVYDEMPDYIAVFGADHVYRMDPGQMLAAHIESGAGCTVAGIRVPRPRRRRSAASPPTRPGASPTSGEAQRAALGPRRPRGHVRLDGQLRLHHRRHARGAAGRRRRRRLRPRHGLRHHSAHGRPGRRARVRLRGEHRARRHRAGRGLLA